jgi:hypothetical protein
MKLNRPCAKILVALTVLAAPRVLGGDASSPAAVLASLDLAGVRRSAEEGLTRKYAGTQAADFQMLYAYHKVDPNKPVNGEALVAVYQRVKPVNIRNEDLDGITRRIVSREHLWVEMEASGRVSRISAKVVEQSEMVNPSATK